MRKVQELRAAPQQRAEQGGWPRQPIGRGIGDDQLSVAFGQGSHEGKLSTAADDDQPLAENLGQGWKEPADVTPNPQRADQTGVEADPQRSDCSSVLIVKIRVSPR